MTAHRLISVLTLALTVACAQQTGSAALAGAPNAEGELRDLQRQWGVALAQRDTGFFSRVLAEDFEGGVGATKARLMASLSSSTGTRYSNVDISDIRVRVFGESAVVTAVATYSGERGGQPFNERNRYLRVFIWRSGRWQAVAGQSTPVTSG